MEKRLSAISYFVALLIFILTFKLFDLQVVQGNKLLKISEQNRTRVYFETAPRGNIYDRSHLCVADNVSTYVVYFSPEGMTKQGIDDTLDTLEEILKIKISRSKLKIYSKSKPAVIRIIDGISRQQMFWLEENKYRLPGINLGMEFKRLYPYGSTACHMIGYLGEINRSEFASPQYAGYRVGSFIGKSGVERIYEPYIRGEDGGVQIEIDAKGNQLRVIRKISCIPGNDVHLFLDLKLQNIIEKAFEKTRGACVVLDPRNGEVLAMLSSPGYDPNMFVSISTDTFKRDALLSSVGLPLFNRALQGRYPPGSVFKIVTASAALDEHKVDPQKAVLCQGRFILGREGKVFKCWKPEGHGWVDFTRGLAESCDVYFYQLGLRVGIDSIEKYGHKYGLDKYTEIDLPGEATGFIPGRNWKKRRYRDDWYDGDTVNVAIGQGYVLTTPIGLACLAATTATRGSLFQPRVVNKIQDQNGQVLWKSSPRKIVSNDMDPNTWKIMDATLQRVVSYGTGAGAAVPGVTVAGKTGTAQNPQGNDHAWFVAYAPAENPEIALSVFMEHGGHGGSVAAPVAQAIIQEMLVNRKKSEVKVEAH
ncbi:MAG: penicillin-binding protein 2 [Elusimicrobiota bacterium]